MNRLKTNPFKAKPVNGRVMKGTGGIGVPKVASRKATEVKGFTFRVDSLNRSVDRSLNDSIDSTSSCKSATKWSGLTTPLSPKFSTDKRLGKKALAPTPSPMSTPKRSLMYSSAKKSAVGSTPSKTLITPFKLSTEERGSATKMKLEVSCAGKGRGG